MATTKFIPTSDRVLVKPREMAKKTPGGLHIPDSAEERGVRHGEVIATGPGRVTDFGAIVETQVRRGETVLWGATAFTTPIKIDDEEYLVISERELLGVAE